jgi:hypothetical protein
VPAGEQERAWQGARLLAFTPAVAASPLAGRPYDLRHACLSTWQRIVQVTADDAEPDRSAATCCEPDAERHHDDRFSD